MGAFLWCWSGSGIQGEFTRESQPGPSVQLSAWEQTAASHIPSSSLGPSSGLRRQADLHLEETLKTFWTCNTQIKLAPHCPLSNSNLPSSKTSMPVGKQVPTQLLRRQETGSFAQSLTLHATNPTNTFCKDPTMELVSKIQQKQGEKWNK